MHRPPPSRRPRRSLAAVFCACLLVESAAVAQNDTPLEVPPGFHARTVVQFAPTAYVGGLAALPNGALAFYDGAQVTLRGPDGSRTVLFTPPEPPVFGSFLRLTPDGAALLFGETHPGMTPHRIYRVPLTPGAEVTVLDAIRFNYDLTFDDGGRGFVSALEAASENRIFLLDGDPEKPSDPVVVGIPIYSGPLAFARGRLYYATASPASGNRIVWFTPDQLEAGIGEGKEVDFNLAVERQVLVGTPESSFNMVGVGRDLFVSAAARIDRVLPDGTVEPFAQFSSTAGGFPAITFLAFRPGPREFQVGAGPQGGSLYASVTDFSTVNAIEEVTPELFFRRGRVNPDPLVDISDAIALLEHLFLGGPPPDPPAAGDLNDDGMVDVSDPIYLLAYLFVGGARPPEPFEVEGPDPTP